jgi:hypothetical protein
LTRGQNGFARGKLDSSEHTHACSTFSDGSAAQGSSLPAFLALHSVPSLPLSPSLLHSIPSSPLNLLEMITTDSSTPRYPSSLSSNIPSYVDGALLPLISHLAISPLSVSQASSTASSKLLSPPLLPTSPLHHLRRSHGALSSCRPGMGPMLPSTRRRGRA